MGRASSRNGGKLNAYRVLVGKSEGRRQKDDRIVGKKIILKWGLEKDGGLLWSGLIWLKIEASGWLLRTR
jgi:hypothetical protein